MSYINPCRSIGTTHAVKAKNFFQRETIGIDSVIKETPLFTVLHEIFCQVRKARGSMDVIGYHRTQLGPETHIFRPEMKWYLWDRSKYRVVVSNTTGIHLEVEIDASFDRAREAVESYLSDMKLPIDVGVYRKAI